MFQHDYINVNEKITNYDEVKKRFDIKIKNFNESLSNEKNILIFINFADNIRELKIDEMVVCLRSKTKLPFYIFIFVNNEFVSDDYTNPSPSNVIIIKSEDSFQQWWLKKADDKYIFHKEIYEKFLDALNTFGLKHDFPITYDLATTSNSN